MRRGETDQDSRTTPGALELADIVDEPISTAQAHLALAGSLTHLGRYAEAARHIDDADEFAARIRSALLTRRCRAARTLIDAAQTDPS